MEKVKCAHTRLEEIHKLVPNPRNPNKHPEKQINMLAKIIDFQGQRSPIVVSNLSGFVVKGHGRLEALKQLGWQMVAVDFQDYTNEAEEYADLVADNKIAEFANSDDGLMIEAIKEFAYEDLELLGLDDFNLDQVKEVKNSNAELDIDAFDNFDHQCPKCSFEWNDDTTS